MTHIAPPTDRLFTINEAAAYLRVSRITMYRLINRGELETVRVGERHRLRLSEIERHLTSR